MPVTADDKHRMRAEIYFELTRNMPIPGVAFDYDAAGVENGDYEAKAQMDNYSQLLFQSAKAEEIQKFDTADLNTFSDEAIKNCSFPANAILGKLLNGHMSLESVMKIKADKLSDLGMFLGGAAT